MKPIAFCDCGRSHWLVRPAVRDGVAGVEMQAPVVDRTKSGAAAAVVQTAVGFWPLEVLRAEPEIGVMLACPRTRCEYRATGAEILERLESGDRSAPARWRTRRVDLSESGSGQ